MKAVGFFGVLGAGRREATSERRAKQGVANGVVVGREIFLVKGKHARELYLERINFFYIKFFC